mmetsp:Transcript_2886/g.414  ORF Transcript_2886/g.414 Transcript_2886/m.414 type:complete len:92 (+) Transcript_2886:252-527(+)
MISVLFSRVISSCSSLSAFFKLNCGNYNLFSDVFSSLTSYFPSFSFIFLILLTVFSSFSSNFSEIFKLSFFYSLSYKSSSFMLLIEKSTFF